MKRLSLRLICLLCIALLFTALSCTGKTEKKEYPERYGELVGLLGETRESALKQLNLTEKDFTETAKGLYSVPMPAQYNGLSFEISLEFDEINGRFMGFSYTKTWEDQKEATIREISALAKALTATFGEARSDIDSERFSSMNDEVLSQAFREAARKGGQVGTDYWLVGKRENVAILDYIQILQEQNQRSEMAGDHLNLTLEMRVATEETSGTTKVWLRFRLEPDYRAGWFSPPPNGRSIQLQDHRT